MECIVLFMRQLGRSAGEVSGNHGTLVSLFDYIEMSPTMIAGGIFHDVKI